MTKPKPYGLNIINTTISSTDGSDTLGWVELIPASAYRTAYYVETAYDNGPEDIIYVGIPDTSIDMPEPDDGTNIVSVFTIAPGVPFKASDFGSVIKNDIYVKTNGNGYPLKGYYLDNSQFLGE
jgi:hypothetical protein